MTGEALVGLARGANEIAKNRNIRAVGPHAAGVHRQAQAFGQFEIDIGIVEFREAEAGCGQNSIEAARIDGPRRAAALHRAASQLVELLPIAFVPSGHALQNYVLLAALDAGLSQKVHCSLRNRHRVFPLDGKQRYIVLAAVTILHNAPWPGTFLRLMFQTRYPVKCFGDELQAG